MNFSVIPFQTGLERTQKVAEPGTGRMVDQKVDEWHTHQAYIGDELLKYIHILYI